MSTSKSVTTDTTGRKEKAKLLSLIERFDWDKVLKRLTTEEGKKEAGVVWGEHRYDHGFVPLHHALYRNAPLEVVEALIHAYPLGVNIRSALTNMLPIHAARQHGACATVVKLLLESDEDGPQVAAGRLGMWDGNALHDLCFNFPDIPLDVVNILINACPDAAKMVDKHGYLPLHYAVKQRNPTCVAVVDALLKTYPGGAQLKSYRDGVEFADHSCALPLHLAVREFADFTSRGLFISETGEIIRLLLNAFPDGVKSRNQNGELPLHLVCNNRNPHPISIAPLLRAFPDGARTQIYNGYLPITLLSRRINERKQTNNNLGLSSEESECAKLLMLAAYHGTLDKSTHLIHAYATGGEDCPFEMLNDTIAEHPHLLKEADNDGNLPLHLEAAPVWGLRGGNSVKSGEVGRLETLLQAFPEGALVRNRTGKVPLLIALEAGRDPKSCEMWKLFQATLPIIVEGEDALCVTLLEKFACSWTDALYDTLRGGFLARHAHRAAAKAAALQKKWRHSET